MENTNNNNNDETRRRRSGTRARGGGGVRLRSSMAARSGVRGVRTRGGQRGDRPLVSEPLFCGMLDNLPEGQTSETAMHPKRARVLPASVAIKPGSETLWSSLEKIALSTPSTSRGQTTPPMSAASLSPQNLLAAEPSTSNIDIDTV